MLFGTLCVVKAVNCTHQIAGNPTNPLKGDGMHGILRIHISVVTNGQGQGVNIHTGIVLEDVQEIVSPSPEYTVFMILDHLLSGKLAEATQVVNSVLQTEPSAVRLIILLASQLRIDAHMKYAMEAGTPLPEVQKALGVTDGRAYHIKKQIRNLSADALRERYLSCIEANYAVTSGQLQERAALDKLLIKLVKT